MTVSRANRRDMTEVHSYDELPEFANEAEEAAFWATHSLGQELLDRMGPPPEGLLPPPRPRTKPVPLRLNDSTIRRAKRLAERRHIGYQTLLKEFITERLYEEEKREGLIG